MQLALIRSGHAVTCATNGLEAWVELAARPDFYDVLITDHDMPQLDGLGLVTQVRAVGFRGRIVVISGNIDQALGDRYHALAVDAILAKPFSADELLGILQTPHDR